MLRRLAVCGIAAAAMLLAGGSGSAQNYPNKVIRIVTSAPGSTNDWVGRLIAKGITPALGQQVTVENRGGLAAEFVARSAPDGYTILLYGSPAWLLPLIRPESYDAVRDLAPITSAVSQVTLLVVHPSLPVRSVKELVTLTKSRPGQLNYAAGTLGAAPHLAMEGFKLKAGIDIVRVSYKGTGPSVIGLYTGEVQTMMAGMGSVAQHLASGRLRALAVTTPQRSPLAPELPTVAETVPGYQFVSEIGIFAPAGTPQSIIELLQRESARVLTSPEVKDLLAKSGIAVVANTPAQWSAAVKADIEEKSKLMKAIGMRLQETKGKARAASGKS